MEKFLKTWSLFFLLLFFFFFFQKNIFAKDYQVDYTVEYFLEEKDDKIQSPVSFKISIKNLRSDVYVDQFLLSFPANFVIKDVKAKDDWGEITPQVASDDKTTKISLKFSQPNIGKDSVNNFYLSFYQENLFKINGNVWEVILPTIEKKEDDSYQIIVNLPKNTDKKISIAKPIPTHIFDNRIFWQNPKEKTIYAVFGDEQYYKTALYYHLKNDRPIPIYTDIALPPDTLYQKIYLEKIDPLPNKVFQDEDGNFLARYILKPLEKKSVIFDGVIEVYAKPRLAIRDSINKNIEKQEKYLLRPNPLWQIDKIDESKLFNDLTTPADIYQFVVKKLTYNYSLVNRKKERLGANLALVYPSNAVCTEFTDLFIALAKEKGVLSREIEGYGFTQDEKLRPLTLTADILHAWPEYFDREKNLWVPIDPTWENTSGIDYFSSFDLNHITFVIHGKDPHYPVSAGMYKLENSQDILIKPQSEKPIEKTAIGIELVDFPKKIDDKNFYNLKFNLKNQSNVYLWTTNVSFEGTNINISPKEFVFDNFLPLEKKEIEIKINSAVKNKKEIGLVKLMVDGKKIDQWSILIVPYYYLLGLKIAFLVLALGLIMIVLRLVMRKRKI